MIDSAGQTSGPSLPKALPSCVEYFQLHNQMKTNMILHYSKYHVSFKDVTEDTAEKFTKPGLINFEYIPSLIASLIHSFFMVLLLKSLLINLRTKCNFLQ